MVLQFHPNPGTFLVCDFHGFSAPEMVKKRPVVVLSPRFRRRYRLVTVVPLSTTPPEPVEPYHVFLKLHAPLHPDKWPERKIWVKCDMIYAVSFARLDPIRLRRDQFGKWHYNRTQLNGADLLKVRKAVAYSIGLRVDS